MSVLNAMLVGRQRTIREAGQLAVQGWLDVGQVPSYVTSSVPASIRNDESDRGSAANEVSL